MIQISEILMKNVVYIEGFRINGSLSRNRLCGCCLVSC